MAGSVILKGIVGSTAYGMARPGSDVDHYGVFAAPTESLVGLYKPEESIVTSDPDCTLHEVGKFCKLALKCNPSVLELLWLDKYERKTRAGEELIHIRDAFLSGRLVRNAYLGYAQGQFERIRSRGDNSFSADTRKRTAKHARHLMRLLHQGLNLYTFGELEVKVEPNWVLECYEFGEKVASGNLEIARTVLGIAEYDWDRARCALPEKPAEPVVQTYLRDLRDYFWRKHDWNE